MSRKTKRKRIEHLVNVLYVQTKSKNQERMVEFLKKEFERLNNGDMTMYEDNGNLYIKKGQAKTYPCVVAHMDTVHNICDNFEIYEHGDALFSIDTLNYTRTGIGGDDKVGVFCALEALESLSSVKVAFFRDEEIGCVGSGLADMDFFEDVSFILQADRKGYDDFVRKIHSVNLFSDAFSKAIAPILTKYGKEECLTGGLTDVFTLFKKGVEVCVANCSCGYYNPHRDGEYVVISEVLATSNLFMEIINSLHVNGERWKMPKYKETPVYNHHTHYNNRHDNYNPHLPKLQDVFHLQEHILKPETGAKDVICPSCDISITDMYDPYEDGYYCTECQQHAYLTTSIWSVNRDEPDDDIISKMTATRRNRKRKNKNRK